MQAPPAGTQATQVPGVVGVSIDWVQITAFTLERGPFKQQMFDPPPGTMLHGWPSAAHGAIWQKPLAQTLEQHSVSVVHSVPIWWQPHFWTCFPLLLVTVTDRPSQHWSQLSFFPFLPRGFLDGHFLPLAIQA